LETARGDSPRGRNRIRPGGVGPPWARGYAEISDSSERMKNETGTFGLILGGIVALAAMVFIFSGGVFGGKTVVNGDQDLPPIAGDASPD
jgi:hypothetical protein